jgi:integrase
MANSVEPIRDAKKIMAIRSMLKGGKHPRDYLIFVLGVNFVLRIADLLSLRVRDVLDEQYEIRLHFTIREGKTCKVKRIRINSTAQDALH